MESTKLQHDLIALMNATNTVREELSELTSQVKKAGIDAGILAHDTTQRLNDKVHKKPYWFIAGAATAGLVLGKFLRKN